MKQKVIVIVGPTASGKTALSIELAKKVGKKKKGEEIVEEPTTKVCPYCLSEIPYKATRCPHCTSNLEQ